MSKESETTGTARTADDSDSDPASDAESEASVGVDDEDDVRTGSVENTTPPAHEENGEEGNGDETVPTVELDLYDLSVRVSGQSTDDLDAVEGTARGLMDYLVGQAQRLEDRPDDRGLS
ncbi:hypothetical protein [Salinigranum sp. GCM10025319]|uniref:hypothetical protein n=1 Tax=Salinigranum sp. GCM10025319 TaxID=3252687 RepID=UPI00362439B4